jgi:pimeloyl-ACP methyl ester carboxylesterase
LILTFGTAQAQTQWPQIVNSKDGTPIAYEVYGAGEPALVFVHGWSCDGRYWRAQVPYFAQKHRVVLIDLAGHGHSGLKRKRYTMQSFGEDVRAVCAAIGAEKVILIGHSMGGAVIAEAAALMPGQVMGLIGVDTLDNIEYPLTKPELKDMMAPLKKDFSAGSRQFIRRMLSYQTDRELREWIMADIAAAPPDVALSAMQEMMAQYISGEAARIFDKVRLPVITINGDLWPINYEANRRHMLSFDAVVLKGADHFLMMDRPDEFNQALQRAVETLSTCPAQTQAADQLRGAKPIHSPSQRAR